MRRTPRPAALRRSRAPRPLLPAAVRPRAAAAVAVCIAVVAVLGTWLAHQSRAGWLDNAVDTRVRATLGAHPAILKLLVLLGDPAQVTWITAALVVACLLTRRWRGAVLVAICVPAAGFLTEHVLKPLIDRTSQGHPDFPSGHATAVFALAVSCTILLACLLRPRLPAAVRLAAAAILLLVAAAVAAAVIGLGYHYFTDTIGGTAVGTGVVLATALVVDRLSPRERAGQFRDRRQARPQAGTAAGEPPRAGQPTAPTAALADQDPAGR